MDRAMDFYNLDTDIRCAHIRRIMDEATKTFNHSVTAQAYIDIYEKMLQRPLLKSFDDYPETPRKQNGKNGKQ